MTICSHYKCSKENTGTCSTIVDGYEIEIYFCDIHEEHAWKTITKIWELKEDGQSN